MFGVEETIGSFALPVDTNAQSRIERGDHSGERVYAQAPSSATLDSRDQRLRNPDTASEIDLTPPSSHPESSHHSADSDRVHSGRLAILTSPPITSRYRAIG